MGWSNSGGWGSHGWSRPASGGSSSLLNGIVAYWKFDEGTGTITADATGNGHAVTLVNSPAWAAGKINDGLSFNGSTNYGTFGPITGLPSLSISAWIKTTTVSSAAMIVGSSGATNFQVRVASGKAGVICGQPGEALSPLAGTTTINDGNWHHIVFTNDPAGNAVLYVDAASEASEAGANLSAYDMAEIARLGYSSAQYFNGTIDEVGIWNRALTAAEVTELYNAGAGNQYPF